MRKPAPTLLMPAGVLLLACMLPLARGEESKDAGKKKDAPRVLCVAPLAVRPGAKTTLRVRGTGLDAATEVRFPDGGSGPKATIKSKGKADALKGFDAKVVGDTQVEVELTIPEDAPAGSDLSIVLVTPAGETEPRKLPVLEGASAIDEKEPNNGFREAQPLDPGKTVLGTIGQEGDVDVFRLDGKAGQSVVAEVDAAKLGSPLDSLLTLYDSTGHVVALNDDTAGTESGKDSKLVVTFPSDGVYYLALSDANDHGSAVHAYRLTLRAPRATGRGEGGRDATGPASR